MKKNAGVIGLGGLFYCILKDYVSIHSNKKQMEVSRSQSRKHFETKEIKGDNGDQTVTERH